MTQKQSCINETRHHHTTQAIRNLSLSKRRAGKWELCFEFWSEKSITSHEQDWFAGANVDNHKKIDSKYLLLITFSFASNANNQKWILLNCFHREYLIWIMFELFHERMELNSARRSAGTMTWPDLVKCRGRAWHDAHQQACCPSFLSSQTPFQWVFSWAFTKELLQTQASQPKPKANHLMSYRYQVLWLAVKTP